MEETGVRQQRVFSSSGKSPLAETSGSRPTTRTRNDTPTDEDPGSHVSPSLSPYLCEYLCVQMDTYESLVLN